MESFQFLRRNARDLEVLLILVLVGISIISCIAVGVSVTGNTTLKSVPQKEIVFQCLGYAAMFFMMFVDYRNFGKFRWYFYGFTTLLLVIVFHFYDPTWGAASWIRLPGGMQFQPSELAKLSVIIWIADYMAKMNAREVPDYSLRALLPIFGVVLVPFALILKEPALGQALVMLAIMVSMLIVYVKKKHFFIMSLVGLLILGGIILAKGVYSTQAIHFLTHQHVIHGYQAKRITTFIDPSSGDPTDTFNVKQAQIAVGSGEMFGIGLSKSATDQSVFVPDQSNDFIFSAIGERLGFVGSSVLIFLFLLLLYRMMRVASTAGDDFGMFFTTGCIGMFAFQIVENVGMNISLMPSTGITLPFVSYGGTSLLTNMLVMGTVLAVSLRRRTLRFA